jgi:hypothetical protein
MACLVALLAAFFPRVALALVWVARPALVSVAFGNVFLWPLLGLIFLPLTTLFYVVLYRPGVGVTGFEWFWIALALVFDLGNWFGSYSQRRFGRPTQMAG